MVQYTVKKVHLSLSMRINSMHQYIHIIKREVAAKLIFVE